MSLAAPSCVQKLRTASPAPCSELWSVCLFREPDVGNPPVRFDEREQETEPCQTGLRRRRESTVNSHREAKATAPVLDSTPDFTHRPRGKKFSCCFNAGCGAKNLIPQRLDIPDYDRKTRRQSQKEDSVANRALELLTSSSGAAIECDAIVGYQSARR